MTKNPDTPPLSKAEEALLETMRLIDNQVAREMQRSPAQRDQHGVQKWEPHQRRVENFCAFVLNALGDNKIDLDSLLILSQAMVKALEMAIEDLGEDGLGAMRSSYCLTALEFLARTAQDGIVHLKPDQADFVS